MSDRTSDDTTPATLNGHSQPGANRESTGAKPRRKRGAPKSNKNAIRHGLTCGQLPKGCAWIATLAGELRKALESAVMDAKGECSLYDAAVINTATRWERHAMLAQRWLRVETGLTIDQKLAFHREVARASSERDKCLKELGLHTSDTHSLIDALYATPHEPDPDDDDPHDANAATVDDATTTSSANLPDLSPKEGQSDAIPTED